VAGRGRAGGRASARGGAIPTAREGRNEGRSGPRGLFSRGSTRGQTHSRQCPKLTNYLADSRWLPAGWGADEGRTPKQGGSGSLPSDGFAAGVSRGNFGAEGAGGSAWPAAGPARPRDFRRRRWPPPAAGIEGGAARAADGPLNAVGISIPQLAEEVGGGGGGREDGLNPMCAIAGATADQKNRTKSGLRAIWRENPPSRGLAGRTSKLSRVSRSSKFKFRPT